MNDEKPYSGKRGLQGCLFGLVIMAVVPVSISLVLNKWLGLISNETERVMIVFIWFLAVCLGGYVAARLGKTTGWTNSLIVGLIAEFLVYSHVPKDPGRTHPTSLDPLLDIINDPGAHWPILVELALTIPVAILGGVIWEKTGGAQSSGKRQSESAKTPEGAKQ
jgi:putative membrane protein (TIGR04086 family)